MKRSALLFLMLLSTLGHSQENWIELGYSQQDQVSFAFHTSQDSTHLNINSKWQALGSSDYTIKSYQVNCLTQEATLYQQQQHSPSLSITTTHIAAMQAPKMNTMEYMLNSTACLFARVQHEEGLILAQTR
ncbi:hypothetical protein [uncultured Acinetobacter sp.]|uniref:hypothetical protein n=1 Tax=uncultured Acinetobacter sp. TaxID=165433 RepID=UPI00261949EE|nr:hypothetical protein [uncultured Acinetobacter sp.]